MKRRVCPICDQVMKSACFCNTCKRIVLHPYEREADYYLNERHPEKEKDCSYHRPFDDTGSEQKGKQGNSVLSMGGELLRKLDGGDTKDQDDTGLPSGRWLLRKFYGGNTAEQENLDSSQRPRMVTYDPSIGNRNTQNSGDVRESYKDIKKKSVPFVAVIVSMSLLYFLFMGIGYAYDLIEEKAYYDNNTDSFEEDYDWEYVMPEEEDYDLSDEAVRAEGIPCNSQNHFNIWQEDAVPVFETYLQESGYLIDGLYTYSYNETSDDGFCQYNTWYDYVIQKEEENKVHFEINFDTANGQMHNIRIMTGNAEEAVELVFTAMDVLKSMNNLDSDEELREELNIYLRESLEEKESYSTIWKGLIITGEYHAETEGCDVLIETLDGGN